MDCKNDPQRSEGPKCTAILGALAALAFKTTKCMSCWFALTWKREEASLLGSSITRLQKLQWEYVIFWKIAGLQGLSTLGIVIAVAVEEEQT